MPVDHRSLGQAKQVDSTGDVLGGEHRACGGALAEIREKLFAGGRRFDVMGNSVVSANITPDKATGIGEWDLNRFLDRFRKHRVPVETLEPFSKETFTLMPWRELARMTDSDLEAIYTYLLAQRAIENKVITHPVHIVQAR